MMHSSRFVSFVLVLGYMLIFTPLALASIKLPALISDNMVLQSNAPVALWGTADPGEHVVVTMGEVKASTAADNDGRWRAQIGPLKPGGPFEMVLTGKNTIVIHNVLVGQVWVCSGQSNMEYHVGHGPDGWEDGVVDLEQEVATAHYPMIRMFTVRKTVAGKPQEDVEGKWEVTSPLTVGQFSAVGYFFGRELFRSLDQPIGLIHSSWGGTPAESWTTLATLQSDPDFRDILDRWEKEKDKLPSELKDYEMAFDRWKRESQEAESQGKPIPAFPKAPNDPRTSPFYRPAGLFNAMIAPLVSYRIKGVIWYQGESNSNRAVQYRKLFPAMIRDWRRAWGEDFPFLFVQLSSYAGLPPHYSFPLLREAQLQTLSLPKTAMTVTIDIGDPDNIHPKNKQEVGRRLALAARAIAYGQSVTFSGPIFSSMEIEGTKMRLRFAHSEDGLATPGHSKRVRGFEIAGADRKFHWAQGNIDGNTVVVESDKVPQPVAVRYSWENYPNGNLYNESGLPASPFRTDNWDDATQAR